MLSETLTGLRRVDRDLYQQDWKGDQPSEWVRVIRRLDILLSDIRMVGGGCFGRLSEDARDGIEPSRRITAAGTLEKRSIYVTAPDGIEPAKGFNDISVTLHRAGDDFEKACNTKAQGDLNSDTVPAGRLLRCGGIYFFSTIDGYGPSKLPEIETLVPSPIFDFGWEQLISSNVTHAHLSIMAEIFQELMESRLAELYHQQDFLIERESSDHPVEFGSLYVHSRPITPMQQG